MCLSSVAVMRSFFCDSQMWVAGSATAASRCRRHSNADVATAMFELFAVFPLTVPMSVLGVVLVVTFFVTSSDSGSLVIDHLTSGGKHDGSVVQRVFWALTEGVVAAVLLVGGGLTALQAASIATGLPFAAVLLLMCYTVYLGLAREHEIMASAEFAAWLERIEADGAEDARLDAATSDSAAGID